MPALVPHTYKFEFAYLLVRKTDFEDFLEVHITSEFLGSEESSGMNLGVH